MKKINVFDLEDLKISVRYGGLKAETFAKYCEAINSYNAKFIDRDAEDLKAAQDAWDLINYYQSETFEAMNRAKLRLQNFIFEMNGRRARAYVSKKSLYDLEQEYLQAENIRQKNSELKSSLFIDMVIELAAQILAQQSGNIDRFKLKAYSF